MKSSKQNLLSFKNCCISIFFFCTPTPFRSGHVGKEKILTSAKKPVVTGFPVHFGRWRRQFIVCEYLSVYPVKLKTLSLHGFLHHKLEYEPKAISFLLLMTEAHLPVKQNSAAFPA